MKIAAIDLEVSSFPMVIVEVNDRELETGGVAGGGS